MRTAHNREHSLNPGQQPPLAQKGLHDHIVASLRELIGNQQGPTLPSMSVLAAHLGVCRTTVWRAAVSLRNEGALDFGGGSKIRISGRAKVVAGPRPDAAERLCAKIVRLMENGTWPCGEPLPKIAYLSATERVSPVTIAEAYRRLITRGLAHRKGKRFVAGAAPAVHLSGTGSVMLVVTRTIDTWEWLCTRDAAMGFGMSFTEQANRHGVRLFPCVLDDTGLDDGAERAHGLSATVRFAKRLGERYTGAVVVAADNQTPLFMEYLEQLGRIGKPVIWFLRKGDVSQTASPAPQKVIRCFADERRMVRAALEHLVALGHRTIAYPHQTRHAWMAERLGHLTAIAAQLPEKPAIIGFSAYPLSTRCDVSFLAAQIRLLRSWNCAAISDGLAYFGETRARWVRLARDLMPAEPVDDDEIAGLLAFGLARSSGRFAEERVSEPNQRAFFIWNSIDLFPCVTSSATAWVVPNDVAAVSYLAWLRRTGIDVPGMVSVLSFDNVHRFGFRKLTSVDPGYSLLGYQAFHAIRQSMPLVDEQKGVLPAAPAVVDKGSTGPAPITPLSAGLRRS